mmetsp:Transcript_22034/g.21726  ORF Transcript_22034/g.21726 Transcript_22034/m.21726 type:complete len:324 (+) Transcript_22034:135-1106(+)
MSGLTVGLMSIDPLDLELKLVSGTPKEISQARQVLPIISKHHFLLVTLLIANSVAMEALPIVLDEMVGSVLAVLISVTFVLIFGEVLPQAFCTGPDQLSIAANLVPLVKIVMWIFYPISWALGKLLDRVIGTENHKQMKKSDIKALVTFKGSRSSTNITEDDTFDPEQVQIILSAMDIQQETLENHIIPMENVYCLSSDTLLTKQMLKTIMSRGYSRVPVYRGEDKNNIIGILLVKRLVGIDENTTIESSGVKLRDPIFVRRANTVLEVLDIFQQGRTHMAFVSEVTSKFGESKILGIITLEDILKVIIKADTFKGDIKEEFS